MRATDNGEREVRSAYTGAGGLERVELEHLVLLPRGHGRIPDQHGVFPKLMETCRMRESCFKG